MTIFILLQVPVISMIAIVYWITGVILIYVYARSLDASRLARQKQLSKK